MKSALKSFIISSALILATLCASAQKEINQYNPEKIFEEGVLLFDNQHYASAKECFNQYISSIDSKNQDYIIMARYYEAASSLRLGDSDGENKIKTFIKENPTNIMADNAKLLYANYLFKNKVRLTLAYQIICHK